MWNMKKCQMKMTAYEFAKNVDEKLKSIPAKDYRVRKTRDTKKILEEEFPLSKLALHLQKMGLEVEVCLSKEGKEEDGSDGVIFQSGYRDRTLKVQIVSSFSEEEYLRMELLNKQGHAPGAGPINRNKKTKEIESELVATKYDQYIDDVTSIIVERYRKKVDRNYEGELTLLIVISEIKLVGIDSWCRIARNVRDLVSMDRKDFEHVFVFNSDSNEVVQFL